MHPDDLYTCCPTCKTVYRTHEAQLSVAAGKVRCKQCRMVFDGRAHLIDLTPEASAEPDERELGPPTVTLRPSIEVAPPSGETAEPLPQPPVGPSPAVPTSADGRNAATPHADEELVLPVWQARAAPPHRAVQWAYGVLAVLLATTLACQAAFHFRHVIAADYPALRPALLDACAALGCTVDPLRNRDEVSIESHDLQADPAHQGLLILQTTLRNQARHALAFPHLELELNDLVGRPVVRRVFAPTEYAGGAADFASGIAASAEWNVKLFIDASSINAGGYNLYLFYP